MQITLSFDTFTELPYTSGTIQNISSQATVEICQEDTANTGLILGPGEWFSWSNSTVYARSAWDYEPVARCAVVPFKKGAEGGGSEYILPVATKNTLGGVKSSTDDGKVKVEADGTMTMNGGGLSLWEPSKFYKKNAVVIYNNAIYLCREAHTSATVFEYDKWIILGGGNGDYGDYVGHITWQMSLQSNYLKLDGTPLANASNDYDELLKFAQDNSLITSDTTDKSLFKYDSGTDVLTLPDYIGLCLQGGNSIEEKEAGLPNIKGTHWAMTFKNSSTIFSQGAFYPTETPSYKTNTTTYSSGDAWVNDNTGFDASKSNSIYSDSVTTVQPPAITLIPQIRYKYSGCVYSTEEQRIGTWIDGKPLYRKVFENPTNGMNTGLTSNANIIKCYGACYNNYGDFLPVPYGNVDYFIACRIASGGTLGISSSSDVVITSFKYIAIEYTKN
jgi:hypothetical protein